MKTLVLSFRNIKTFIQKKTLLFIIIVGGLAVSVAGIFFYTGYFLNLFRGMNEPDEKIVQISFQEGADPNQIQDFLNSMYSGTLPALSRVAVTEVSQEILDSPIGSDNMQDMPVLGEDDADGNEHIISGRYFEKDSMKNEAIVTDTALDLMNIPNPLGKQLSFRNQDFAIIGVAELMDFGVGVVVSLPYFFSHYTPRYMSCEFTSALSKAQRDYISQQSDLCPAIKELTLPVQWNPLKSPGFLMTFGQILLIFAVAMINVFTLLYFWIKNNRRLYSIYTLCGCKGSVTSVIIVLNSMLISVFAALIGLLLYALMAPYLIGQGLVCAFSVLNYLGVIAVVLAVTLMLAAVMSGKYKRNAELYKIRGE